MAIRFRRSITIAPGIRLNLGKRGASVSAGPRGASVSIGSRGVYGNVGLPGTGLSYRQRLDAVGGKAARRSAYRTTLKEARAAERAAMQHAALDVHHASEQRFAELQSLLRDRVRDPYDWDALWKPRGPFQPERFRTPASPPDPPHEPDSTIAPGTTRWLLIILSLTLISLAFGSFPVRVLSLAFLVGAIAWAVAAQRQFRARNEDARRQLAVDLENDVRELKQQHDKVQEGRRSAWEAEEETRRRIFSARINGNVEILCDVLEAELANESLPVPLVFDLSMTAPDVVQIELSLPELGEVPTERTRITQTGKLSRKAVTMTERTGMYADLCTGLALRLAHETFRVVPPVDRFEVIGTALRVNPESGHQEEIVALHLGVTRSQLKELYLDEIDPSSAFASLGGAFACNRRGEISPLAGISGSGS